MKYFIFIWILLITISCQKPVDPIIGKYALSVSGLNNTSTGELEIVGEQGDYFGKITFDSKRKRVYEIGLRYKADDSISFILPGNAGFLRLKRIDEIWSGSFKYFGIQAEISASKTGNPSAELQSMVGLKPIGLSTISTDQEESFPSYDDTNDILYYGRDQKIYQSQKIDGDWSSPVKLPFSDEYNDSAPYVFNNGNSLLFTSNRPINDSLPKKKNLWFVERNGDDWSSPIPFPSPINIDTLGDYHGGVSANGNIYFISYNRDNGFGRSDIYRGQINEDGNYIVTNLGARINSDLSEADVYIAPDEKYLLFASTGREDSYGADDIYISFKEENSWSTPQNLGPAVNTFAYEYGAWVDQKNNYLYFNSFRRGTSDIYRIKLEELELLSSK